MNAHKVVFGDVREAATVRWLVQQADYVIHAAAYADVAACTREPEIAFAANLHGTQTVLQETLRSPVKRLVFVSSASVYGNGRGEGVQEFTESQPLVPISVYANTKLWGEHQARLMLGGSEREFAVLRYFSVFGDPQVPKPGSHSWMVPWLSMSAQIGCSAAVWRDLAARLRRGYGLGCCAARAVGVVGSEADVPPLVVPCRTGPERAEHPADLVPFADQAPYASQIPGDRQGIECRADGLLAYSGSCSARHFTSVAAPSERRSMNPATYRSRTGRSVKSPARRGSWSGADRLP
ncbi:hypothetical protein ACVWXU_005601 [Streptomyces sp. TE33382]